MAFDIRNKLIPFFTKNAFRSNDSQKLYMVLADSGMGKSTFLINLLSKYKRKLFKRQYDIRLIPLGHPKADQEIKSLDKERQTKTILLLDAFDEDTKVGEDYKERLNEIVRMTYRYRYVVLTCRTQFFPSEADEPQATNLFRFSLDGNTFHTFKKVYLSPFTNREINQYLYKKYPVWKVWLTKRRKQARALVLLCPNLMVRPMLLSYIDSLVEGSSETTTAPRSASDAYAILINHWISREANRISPENRDGFSKNMHQFSLQIAINIFMNRKDRGGLYIDARDITDFARTHNINLSNLDLRGKSLLNRDASGRYKFAHKSILEFLLARYAVQNVEFADGVYYFKDLEGFDQAKKFYGEMHTTGYGDVVEIFYAKDTKEFRIKKAFDLMRNSSGYRIFNSDDEDVTDLHPTSDGALTEFTSKFGKPLRLKLVPGQQVANFIFENNTPRFAVVRQKMVFQYEYTDRFWAIDLRGNTNSSAHDSVQDILHELWPLGMTEMYSLR